MTLVRRIARPLLASLFVQGGIDTLRDPASRVPAAEPVARRLGPRLGLDQDTETLVKLNAATQVAAGLMLATGRAPRLSALVLAGTLVPTTLAGHRFWEAQDKAARRQQQIQFLKNASVFGGLLLAAVDTEGKPSMVWRASHASAHLPKGARRAARAARLQAALAARGAVHKLPGM